MKREPRHDATYADAERACRLRRRRQGIGLGGKAVESLSLKNSESLHVQVEMTFDNREILRKSSTKSSASICIRGDPNGDP